MEQEITREYIEQLNDIEPCCFENDREEQWFSIGLKYGLDIADSNPKSPWISVEDDLPYEYPALLVSMNSTGTVLTKTDRLNYIVQYMYYIETRRVWKFSDGGGVTHWMPIPKLSKE